MNRVNNKFLQRQDVENLAVLSLLPELRRELKTAAQVVLQAPPGSGKTTLLPLMLRDEEWLAGLKIVMLEPRRLAARAAAQRMAELLGERVGDTVGFRVRHESVVSRKTKIEVVTEGILTRFLQNDPALTDYGLVIFDEFHERHLHADLGLTFVLQAQELLRPELKLLIMSATLAAREIAGFLDDAPLLEAQISPYPVQTCYGERVSNKLLLPEVARLVTQALNETVGDVLVFLPGAGEIRRLMGMLRDASSSLNSSLCLDLIPLYGSLPRRLQDQAFQPVLPGHRKVVLATDIAESSLTIPGVRVVVDSGWRRVMRFDSASAMGRLKTVKISRAAADQRRGRAAREGPGWCYRLWGKGDESSLMEFNQPEIMTTDLSSMALEMAVWGVSRVNELRWLTKPPQALIETSFTLLQHLGAVDGNRSVTKLGREMAALGAHPRLAKMMLAGKGQGHGRLAVSLAVLLNERDPLSDLKSTQASASGVVSDCDIDLRLKLLLADAGNFSASSVDQSRLQAIHREVKRLSQRLGVAEKGSLDISFSGELLALAFPDRIARKRDEGELRFLLSGGNEASFAHPEPLSHCQWLVIPELSGERRSAQVRLAAAYSESRLREQFAESLQSVSEVFWDQKSADVVSRQRLMFNSLTLEEGLLRNPLAQDLAKAWLDGFSRVGLKLLPWNEKLQQWCARVDFVRNSGLVIKEEWPACDDESLLAEISDWLMPHLGGVRNSNALLRFDLSTTLHKRLTWQQLPELERLAPTHINLPSGRRTKLDYCAGSLPVLAARVQEFFGCLKTPKIGGGKIPVLLHLLSPAQRPVQITDDLAGFWHGSYPEVRKEMRGRYPKHSWPEKPWL